jgi:hypothetical protein
MAMMLQDMKGSFQVENSVALEEKLNKRYGSGVNEFWLSHKNDDGAKLAILVSNELANVHYFPPGKHPGYNSIGSIPELDVRGYSKFSINNPDELQWIGNAHVVPFSAAVNAAKEFFERDELPKSINWLEL